MSGVVRCLRSDADCFQQQFRPAHCLPCSGGDCSLGIQLVLDVAGGMVCGDSGECSHNQRFPGPHAGITCSGMTITAIRQAIVGRLHEITVDQPRLPEHIQIIRFNDQSPLVNVIERWRASSIDVRFFRWAEAAESVSQSCRRSLPRSESPSADLNDSRTRQDCNVNPLYPRYESFSPAS